MRQVFPGVLVGREAELAELATFCTADEGPAYVWWQGEAWAGKTALVASFVLAPPVGVRVVSFFITARWAGQSDRNAFLGAVLPQLSQITGESLPDVLTEAHRHEWFLRLMDDAARLCAADGGRLVLVVDGLDEDRGVTAGPDAHSIAALLPADPSHGARVVVAGRPNPPVPSDVPDWHPLCNPEIVRPLSAVPAAVAARREAERELLYLVDDEGLGRELLGLLTASGGGLSGRDLAELAEVSVWEVERVLRAVTGRTFTSRDSVWQSESDRLFVLAHEELQQTALHCLGGDLDKWRNQVHVWADSYRSRSWPAGTPEYLLRGYLPMLLKTGDVQRMTALATDRSRLDRMLDVSGGDAATIADITSIQEYIRDQPHPDLTATLHLAYTRQYISQRNSNIPNDLPAVWAILGNAIRAETLVQSVTNLTEQVKALALLIGAVVETGGLDQARLLTDQAEAITHSTTDPFQRAMMLGSLAEAAAEAGEFDRAVAVTRSITDPFARARELASLVKVAKKANHLDRVQSLIDQAEATTHSITDLSQRARMLVLVAEAAAEAGEFDRAAAVTRSITDPYDQERALASLAKAAAEAGEFDRAAAVTRSITDPPEKAGALAFLAKAAARIGDLDRARLLIDRAEVAARSIIDLSDQAWTLASLAKVVIKTDDLNRVWLLIDQAEAVARSTADADVHPLKVWRLGYAATVLWDLALVTVRAVMICCS